MSETKQFKTESKRLLNLMINSIYTNKEIFLRELISNASDAIDKYHYLSLTDEKLEKRNDYHILLEINKENRTLKIIDNGIGMTADELNNNLGTIASSGSSEFIKKMKSYKFHLVQTHVFDWGVTIMIGSLTAKSFEKKLEKVLPKILETLESINAPKKDVCPPFFCTS